MTFVKIIKNSIIALVSILIFLLLAGFVYQTIGNYNDSKRFPRVGRDVVADGIRFNIDCTGSGETTVVLESAGGYPGRQWALVQPEVAKFARVCSYDRAGFGFSDSSPRPRTMEEEAKELKSLLDAAGEKGPFVLAGNSQGGFNIQAFTKLYPNDVAGVVLADTSHPDFYRKTYDVLSKEGKERFDITYGSVSGSNFRLAIPLSYFGFLRLTIPKGDLLEQELAYYQTQPKALETFAQEIDLFTQSEEYIRNAGNMRDTPLIVLTGGKIDAGGFATPADDEAAKKVWVEDMQASMAKLSTNGKQVIVNDATHLIPLEKPEAVVDAIKEVVNQKK
jgi:pimeloyl-ACP methyl ester carboxylesterase